MITQERLKELAHYDPETGVFAWKIKRGCIAAGQKAGRKTCYGYIRIQFDGCDAPAHHWAVLWMTGEAVPDQIDHINGVRDDNRWSNIRFATSRDNNRNQRLQDRNRTGLPGVGIRSQDGCFCVNFIDNDGNRHQASRKDFFEAVCIRKSMEAKSGTYHYNHGRAI